MKKYFYIQPRESGKTHKAIYEFLKEPEETLLVFPTERLAQENREDYGYDNIIGVNKLGNKISGGVLSKIKRIILDDYMLYEVKVKIYEFINKFCSRFLEEIYIFTTFDKRYNRDLFNIIKKIKKDGYIIQDLLETQILNFRLILDENSMQDIKDLYYNFVTDSDTKVIDTNLSINKGYKDEDYKEFLFRELGSERYKLEILNEYLK